MILLRMGFRALLCVPLCILLLGVAPANAQSKNPNTDWFPQAGWGVFVHYLADLQNNPAELNSLGKGTSWDDCVAERALPRGPIMG